MQVSVKTFDELSTDELYQILRLRSDVFVVEQDCVYQEGRQGGGRERTSILPNKNKNAHVYRYK